MSQVSIITATYNSSQYISETISSVLNQSFTDWELIIVDDCSDDNTIDIVTSFLEDHPRIKLIKLHKNCGAAVARNKAIEKAAGRYIAFLDSDDLWFPEKLNVQINYMLENQYPFVYSAYEKINESGQNIGQVGVPEKVSYVDLLKVCSIGCLTVVYDTNFFGKVYMPLIRKRQDLGLWLSLLRTSNYAYGLNVSLAKYRVRTGSISSNKIIAAKFTWVLYREIEKLSFTKALYFFLHYAFNGFLRTKLPRVAKAIRVLK